MPRATFRADLLKTVAVHTEQKTDTQTDTQSVPAECRRVVDV